MRYITRCLNNKDYTNLRLTNKYIAEKIKLEINYRMQKYGMIGCTGTAGITYATGVAGNIGTTGVGNLFGIAGYVGQVGSAGFIGNPFLLPIHHNNQYNQYNRRIQIRNNKMQYKKYHQRK